MPEVNIKSEAHALVENLSEGASWDDLMKEIYVRQAIESGLADSRSGRVATVQEVREKYGLLT
jgi:predicted transcriptional regulator